MFGRPHRIVAIVAVHRHRIVAVVAPPHRRSRRCIASIVVASSLHIVFVGHRR
jgi:hypothetical protein